jgi:hypothetical protein
MKLCKVRKGDYLLLFILKEVKCLRILRWRDQQYLEDEDKEDKEI